jgi:hypothetical protein
MKDAAQSLNNELAQARIAQLEQYRDWAEPQLVRNGELTVALDEAKAQIEKQKVDVANANGRAMDLEVVDMRTALVAAMRSAGLK